MRSMAMRKRRRDRQPSMWAKASGIGTPTLVDVTGPVIYFSAGYGVLRGTLL